MGDFGAASASRWSALPTLRTRMTRLRGARYGESRELPVAAWEKGAAVNVEDLDDVPLSIVSARIVGDEFLIDGLLDWAQTRSSLVLDGGADFARQLRREHGRDARRISRHIVISVRPASGFEIQDEAGIGALVFGEIEHVEGGILFTGVLPSRLLVTTAGPPVVDVYLGDLELPAPAPLNRRRSYLARADVQAGWWVVHPAWGARRADATDWVGVTSSQLGTWPAEKTEAQQEKELRDLWADVVTWAGEQGADRLVVEDTLPEFAPRLLAAGFAPRSRSRAFSLRGSTDEMCRALAAIRDVPAVSLSVFARGGEIVCVRDLSWDSVFVRLGGSTHLTTTTRSEQSPGARDLLRPQGHNPDVVIIDEWIERVRSALSELGGRVYVPPAGLSEVMDGELLRLGARLGLLRSGSAVDAVGEDAPYRRFDDASVPALSFWFHEVVQLYLGRWMRGFGDVRVELVELCDAWGSLEAAALWAAARPTGTSALWFGAVARRRVIARIERWATVQGRVLRERGLPTRVAATGAEASRVLPT